ncbi:MAG: MBOAT family O-acyltransferase [Oscillospiraceae bacterium]
MLLSGLSFLYFFLPLAMAVYYLAPAKYKNAVLLVTGLLFYSWGEPVYVLVLVLSAAANFGGGLLLDRAREKPVQHRLWFALFLTFNLAVLCGFAYFPPLTQGINRLFHLSLTVPDAVLPVGISFYTFRNMSYLIDLWRGKVTVQKSFVTYGAFAAMFPLVSAGPAVRYAEIEAQLVSRKLTAAKLAAGVELFVKGLSKKVLLANNIGPLWQAVKPLDYGGLSLLGAWIGILAFAFEIYFDFSGYSDMAQGLGKLLGFDFPDNFSTPYAARSVTDFWKRWNITLVDWFRLYVLEPLTGKSHGALRRTAALALTWTLFGIWHGARLNFAIWGLYFFALILLEKHKHGKLLARLPNPAPAIVTFLLVLAGWVMFVTGSMEEAGAYFRALGGFTGKLYDKTALSLLNRGLLFFVLCVFFSSSLPARLGKRLSQTRYEVFTLMKPFLQLLLLMLCTAYIAGSDYNPFLYNLY